MQFPHIKTDRLRLNELTTADIPFIIQYAGNKKISDTTLNIPYPYSEKDAEFWINLSHEGFKNGTNLIFAIRLKESSSFVGGISLKIERRFNRAEIGYWLAEQYWNKGYMTEAVKALLAYAFSELGLNKVTSSHLVSNPASGKVMIKCGMKKEGILMEHTIKNGEYCDLVVYGITKRQYSG